MGFDVRHPEIEKQLYDIGQILKGTMKPGWGFTLLIFDYEKMGDTGSMFYISSALREDMILAMREMIKKLESEDCP